MVGRSLAELGYDELLICGSPLSFLAVICLALMQICVLSRRMLAHADDARCLKHLKHVESRLNQSIRIRTKSSRVSSNHGKAIRVDSGSSSFSVLPSSSVICENSVILQ